MLILAAGSSSRMRGKDKLLENVDGDPLLLRQAENALSVARKVIVTLPPDRPARSDALAEIRDRLTLVTVPDADTGMSASFRAVARLGINGPVMVLPADMPDITAKGLERLWQEFEQYAPRKVVRAATSDGVPGHPVIFPTDLVGEFSKLQGDEGARRLLKPLSGEIIIVPLPGKAAVTDLDTPEDWEAWRRERRQSDHLS